MKRIFSWFLTFLLMMSSLQNVYGNTETAGNKENPGSLYALSAVLMDGDTGRILYEKEGDVPRPMASTTKIMTCILALELADGDDYVEISENAAAQPEVKLGVRVGEVYYMEDLLYSLMLRSHNDTAVAIAEHVGGSVEGFAELMNRKAKELGCEHTHFVTPNGLDAEDAAGEHLTTAAELAKMMNYVIQNKKFLKITQTRNYKFRDLNKTREFAVSNTNALLDMEPGVISGKTGFTGKAGYCYVCAYQSQGKTLIIALLGCGWPNNKTYKWQDTRKLIAYGMENYHFVSVWKEPVLEPIPVKNGVEPGSDFGENVTLLGNYTVTSEQKQKQVLVKDGEVPKCYISMESEMKAPVLKGEQIGEIIFSLDQKELLKIPVTAEKNVGRFTYAWCVQKLFYQYFH